jgi:hypothetical protein
MNDLIANMATIKATALPTSKIIISSDENPFPAL